MRSVSVAKKLRGVSISLALVLLLSTVSAIPAASGQTVARAGRMHFGYGLSLGDSIPAYANIHGVNSWEMWICNDKGSSGWIVNPHVTITSPIDPSSLEFDPDPSISSGPPWIFDWSLQSISPGTTRYVDMAGYPPYTFSPMFDSSRTISPSVISSDQVNQTVTVRVTPHCASEWVWVRVALMWPDLVTPTFLEASPPFNDTGTWGPWKPGPWGQWKLTSYPEKEYVLTCTIQLVNNAHQTVYYKPRVSLGCWGRDLTSSALVGPSTGSSITAQDGILGSITYSASGSYQWVYEASEGTLIDYIYISGYGTSVPLGGCESNLFYAPENGVYFIFASNSLAPQGYSAELDATSSQLVYGMCESHQEYGYDLPSSWVLPNGKPDPNKIGGGESIVLFGGPGAQRSVAYYEKNTFWFNPGTLPSDMAPARMKWNSTHYWYETKDGVRISGTVARKADVGPHNDFFIYQVFYDGDGRLVFIAYGYNRYGTNLAAFYFKDVVSYDFANYPYSWYIFHWTDLDSDSALDQGEVEGIAAG